MVAPASSPEDCDPAIQTYIHGVNRIAGVSLQWVPGARTYLYTGPVLRPHALDLLDAINDRMSIFRVGRPVEVRKGQFLQQFDAQSANYGKMDAAFRQGLSRLTLGVFRENGWSLTAPAG